VKTVTRRLLVLLAALVVLVAACGDSEGEETTAAPNTTAAQTTAAPGTTAAPSTTAAPGTTAAPDTTEAMEPVTITWWHIQNEEPMLSVWQELADEYMALHPNVTIEITVMENEAFKSALQANMQAGDVPDLFQSWGGGGLRAQVEAGLVRDITDLAAPWIDIINPGALPIWQVGGRQYAIPFNLGMVGMWYNKALFEQAGVSAPLETWDDLLAAVDALKAAGITPIAVGAGDKWPAHFWYSYLLVRYLGQDGMNQLAADGNFNVPGALQACETMKQLIDKQPFQDGFLAATWTGPDSESAVMGTGAAAFDLMGQWAANSFRENAPEGELVAVGDNLGWFPFPSVEGGAGGPKDGFGGGDGFAVGKDAPDEAVDFLAFLSSLENAKRIGATGTTLPVTIGAASSVEDPNNQLVLAGMAEAPFIQLYLDQFFSPAVGAAVNDAVQTVFAGTATCDEMSTAISNAWAADQ
jgi:raffinose/stachyose/melibiose transport system substrate-binding protein